MRGFTKGKNKGNMNNKFQLVNDAITKQKEADDLYMGRNLMIFRPKVIIGILLFVIGFLAIKAADSEQNPVEISGWQSESQRKEMLELGNRLIQQHHCNPNNPCEIIINVEPTGYFVNFTSPELSYSQVYRNDLE